MRKLRPALDVLFRAAFVPPAFDDPEMECRYLMDRRRRQLPKLRILSGIFVAACVIWLFMPKGDMRMKVWYFYRANNFISALGALTFVIIFHRCPSSMRYHDLAVTFWAMHFLAVNSLTRAHTEQILGLETSAPVHDEGYQLVICSAWIAGFLAHAEIRLQYFVVIIHIGLACWVALCLHYGTSLENAVLFKLTAMYYVLCVCITIQIRLGEKGRQTMWMLMEKFHRQADEERAVAQAERETVVAKVNAAEQEAIHSFMVAVFDIFGHLEWRTSTYDDEPRLCFEETPNVALDDLLRQSVKGQSLEVLLGAPPAAASGDRERWRRERQRLWEYAAIEAAEIPETDGNKTAHVARKIGLTCADAVGNSFEVELFIRPGFAGSAIFGILVLQRAFGDSAPEQNHQHPYSVDIGMPGPRTSGTRSVRSAGSGRSSSSAGSGWPLPLLRSNGCQEEISAWVDASCEGLPILKCSVGFTLIAGPSPLGLLLLDMLVDGNGFLSWLQFNMNAIASDEPQQDARGSSTMTREVKLRPPGSASSFIEFRAECSLVEDGVEGAECSIGVSEVDNWDMGQSHSDFGSTDAGENWSVLLVFRNVTQHRRKKERNKQARHTPVLARPPSYEQICAI